MLLENELPRVETMRILRAAPGGAAGPLLDRIGARERERGALCGVRQEAMEAVYPQRVPAAPGGAAALPLERIGARGANCAPAMCGKRPLQPSAHNRAPGAGKAHVVGQDHRILVRRAASTARAHRPDRQARRPRPHPGFPGARPAAPDRACRSGSRVRPIRASRPEPGSRLRAPHRMGGGAIEPRSRLFPEGPGGRSPLVGGRLGSARPRGHDIGAEVPI